MSNKHPRTVDELFPDRWLRADDLNGRSYTLTISRITFEELHNPRTNQKELKAILSFERAQKQMVLNKTQCRAIADIARSQTFSDWPGNRVTLVNGRTRQGKPTITIIAPSAAPIAPAETAAPVAEEEDFEIL